ncbi:MAG: hypothetical protein R3301_03120 [Saprospiraceae bacterium]|nr:hypothetical protein [Saprospiraceae bacterium]
MKYPVHRAILFLIFTLVCTHVASQTSVLAGPAFQAYPTGSIPGVHLELGLTDRASLTGRIGYNIVYHGDAGVHDDERGGGFGFSLGYRRHLGGALSRWFGEMRCDIWFNEIDWEDRSGDTVVAEGTSEVTVVQPTAKVGYRLAIGQGGTQLVPSLAFGAEINAQTKGAAVGQGAILLVGLSLGIPIGG